MGGRSTELGAMKAVSRLFFGVVFAHAPASRAQIYTFADTPVPANETLVSIYRFYVYSLAEAPEISAGSPFIKFSNLKAKPTDRPIADVQNYKGVQLSILRERDLSTLIDSMSFCSSPEDVAKGLSEEPGTLLVKKSPDQTFGDVNVYRHTVPFTDAAPDVEKTIKESGAYLLAFSNCGTFDAATISGDVIVKNPYGFLPGVEYHKMPFYGWLLLIYGLLGIIWLSLTVRWWTEILYIQGWIAVVIILGLIESFIWYIYYHNWNVSGVRGDVAFVLAILSTVTKSCFSYMLVLVASLGWGVTRPFLDESVVMKIKALSLVYIIFCFIRESVLSYRHSHGLSVAFVMLCLVPVSMLNSIIFYWVFSALSNLITNLEERRQTEKLRLFQRLWKVLLTGCVIAILCFMFQVVDMNRPVIGKWKYQWLFTDGVMHLLFLFVLVAMMYLWAPHKGSQRYAYSAQVDNQEKSEDADGKHIWADDDVIEDDEKDEDDSFWAATKEANGDKKAGLRAKGEVIGAEEASL